MSKRNKVAAAGTSSSATTTTQSNTDLKSKAADLPNVTSSFASFDDAFTTEDGQQWIPFSENPTTS
eukprot:2008344-Ditylum_brightwellii.AAC.1